MGVKNIGVLGGMFDPVHNGHLSTALSALEEFGLDEVRMVPCGSPVHRQSSIGTNQDRIEMLSLATKDEPSLIVDERECETSSPSYTMSTLSSLKADVPDSNLFLLLGVDAFNSLPTWHQWQSIFDLANVVVITRPGWDLDENEELHQFTKNRHVSSFEELKACSNGKVLAYGFTPLMIGSTRVRRLINDKKSARYLLPDSVWAYIKENNLYT